MTETQSRSERWFKVLIVIAVLYGAFLFVVGCMAISENLHYHLRGSGVDTQDLAVSILLLLFLPFVLIGLRKPRLASILLFAAAGGSIVNFLLIGNSTGDGTAAEVVGSLGFFTVPMLLCAFLYRWRSAWR